VNPDHDGRMGGHMDAHLVHGGLRRLLQVQIVITAPTPADQQLRHQRTATSRYGFAISVRVEEQKPPERPLFGYWITLREEYEVLKSLLRAFKNAARPHQHRLRFAACRRVAESPRPTRWLSARQVRASTRSRNLRSAEITNSATRYELPLTIEPSFNHTTARVCGFP